MLSLPWRHPAVLLAILLLVVGLALWITGRLHRVLPRGSRLERLALRWAVAAQALIVVAGALACVFLVYQGDVVTWRALTLLVFVAALWTLRHALSDLGSGLTLRAEGALRIGERLGVEGARGRVVALGLRSAEVEADDGGLLRIPYSALATAAIETSSPEAVTRSSTFTLELPPDADPETAAAELVKRALLSPWSSAGRAPTARVVEPADGRARVEVTVFPVDPGTAPRVEAALRASLLDAPPPGASGGS